MTARKLYESKDLSINVSVEVDWFRWLIGFASTDSQGEAARMRMFVFHIGPICLAFCNFTFKRKDPKRQTHQSRKRH